MTDSGAVLANPVPLGRLRESPGLLQTSFWAEFKSRFGWKAFAFSCSGPESGMDRPFLLLVLARSLAPGAALAYIPHGPLLEEPGREPELFLKDLGHALRPLLPRQSLFLRFDLPWSREGAGNLPAPLAEGGGLFRAAMDVQPASTVVLDLRRSEEELLAGMKPKTRYNIRLASTRGVEVSEGSSADLEAWYALMLETAARDRLSLHSLSYYRGLFECAASDPAAALSVTPAAVSSMAPPDFGPPVLKLYLARYSGELAAGIIVARRGDIAWYLYGASSNRHRSHMPNYALQWRAIREARARGCVAYDLFGIPPADDPLHPMHGLYRFKTGFGGRILNRYGCYDLAYRSVGYRAYRLLETLRREYHRGWRKRIRGKRP